MPPAFHRPSLLVQGLISLVNGAITLVLLLIAPLGLASVITLTLLITASTFCCGALGRVLQQWLEGSDPGPGTSPGQRRAIPRSLPPATRRLPKR
ncbi:CRISPR-associated protein Csx18 [Aphanothece minutissima]|uniref:DUF2892 domain-containing protein n=1 Tax=Aphanothece cf. minutissima CCALA 015 TaxID=2107695 RepID=A0ABX5FC16_9CHRO|nr:CRISPR-associated protein Csx18 [Aphanothece minutissima]PSB39476.1 hypothetical protein C7B81_02205 [Aphanothece cf. minutissima CCALA 015]